MNKEYKAKSKQLKKFFMSKFNGIIQKKIVAKEIKNFTIEQLKELQHREILEDTENYAILPDEGLSLLKLSFNKNKIVTEIIPAIPLIYKDEPKDLYDFCHKYFWELPDFLATDFRGYGEMLSKIRDYFYIAKLPLKKDVIKIIDELIRKFKNGEIDSFIALNLDFVAESIYFSIAPREEKLYYLEAVHDMKHSLGWEDTLIVRIPKIKRMPK
jgi:hypothetical protein